MKCPNCKDDSGIVIHKDVIICNDCGKRLVISYNACRSCSFTWRDNNGKFMDGNVFDEENIQEVLNDLDEIVDDSVFNLDKEIEGVFESAANEKMNNNMSDMIHKCIKCGEVAVPTDDFNFECPFCGFEWEILCGEK